MKHLNLNRIEWPTLLERLLEDYKNHSRCPLQELGKVTYCAPAKSQRIVTKLINSGQSPWYYVQHSNTKKSIYAWAQQWMEHSNQTNAYNSLTLLRLAIAGNCMCKWRNTPNQFVENLDWGYAMMALNECPRSALRIDDIKKLLENIRPFTKNKFFEAMLWSYNSHNYNLATFIETTFPGLWLEYLFSEENDNYSRSSEAEMYMRTPKMDAWALSQYNCPAASFQEAGLNSGKYRIHKKHHDWAHQWWIGCGMQMDRAQALHLVRNISGKKVRPTNLPNLDMNIFMGKYLVNYST